MKNLVFQVDVPQDRVKYDGMFLYHAGVYDLCKQSALRYARRCGADYFCLSAPRWAVFDFQAAFQRYSMFDADFDAYDSILYLDCDIMVRDDTASIFHEFQSPGFAAARVLEVDPECPAGRRASIKEQCEHIGISILDYFNSGVLLVDRATRQKLRTSELEAHLLEWPDGNDQPFINAVVARLGLRFTALPARFNTLVTTAAVHQREEPGFYHYIGGNKRFLLPT